MRERQKRCRVNSTPHCSNTPMLRSSSRRQVVEAGFELTLAFQTDNLLRDLALLEEEQRGNGLDAVFRGQGLLLINVHFADPDPASVFFGQLIQNGPEHFAGTAPFRPEINQDRCGRLEDFSGKILLRQIDNVERCHNETEFRGSK